MSFYNTACLTLPEKTGQEDQHHPVLLKQAVSPDFASSLKGVLKNYFFDSNYFPGIETTSEIIGIKPRTLQRKLALEGATYSSLIDELRFNAAIPLLRDTDSKLIDIAFDLGYSDPAHFTRAFQRWVGISPSSYRALYCFN